MTKRCWVSLSLSVASIFLLLAMALAQSNNRQPAAWIAFEREQEIDLALSAAPEHLRAQAGVFVLQKGGYVRVRESRNGFTCLVQRGRDPKTGHLQTVPLCFDAEGTATNLRTLLRTRELAEQGESEAKIEQLIAEEYRTGQLQAPRRPGIVYALSSFLAYDQQTGNTHQVVPPFVLIYAPFATPADLGILPEHQGNSSHPYLINEGKPNAYILVTPNRQPGIYKPETTATMESEHKPLTKAGEIELALSAAPEHLRAQAGVFVLEGGNYVKARESRNGFNCLVGRADNILDPMCLDREGSQTTMQAVMRRSQLSAQGKAGQRSIEPWPPSCAPGRSSRHDVPASPTCSRKTSILMTPKPEGAKSSSCRILCSMLHI